MRRRAARVTRSHAERVNKAGSGCRRRRPRDRRRMQECRSPPTAARHVRRSIVRPAQPKPRSEPRHCRRTSASTASSAVSATARRARSSSATTTSSAQRRAIKRVRAGDRRRSDRRPLLGALLRRRGGARSAGCSTRTSSRSSTRCPTRSRPTWSWSTSPAARCARTAAPTRLLSLELIVEIGFKCAMALGYVYRQGLIHRDVKPAEPAGGADQRHDHRRQDHRFRQRAEPRLGRDARSTASARSPTCRPSSSTAARIDCRADIYSLGAVLYHLIAGRPLFDAQVQSAMMHQIYNVKPASLIGAALGRQRRRSTT